MASLVAFIFVVVLLSGCILAGRLAVAWFTSGKTTPTTITRQNLASSLTWGAALTWASVVTGTSEDTTGTYNSATDAGVLLVIALGVWWWSERRSESSEVLWEHHPEPRDD